MSDKLKDDVCEKLNKLHEKPALIYNSDWLFLFVLWKKDVDLKQLDIKQVQIYNGIKIQKTSDVYSGTTDSINSWRVTYE